MSLKLKLHLKLQSELPNMSPDSNVIETEATSKASTELPNMSPDSNVY